jgi:phytoene synthase
MHPTTSPTPAQYVHERGAPHGSSFHYALLFLPAERREAMTAFIAFCRDVAAVAVEVHDPGVAATKLAWWDREVDSAFAGTPSHPTLRALMPHAAAHGLKAAQLKAVIAASAIDLEQSRFLDWPALEHYVAHQAHPAGEIAAQVMGATLPDSLAFARRLGDALKLTEIIRDVGDDARHGRIYLPISELQQHDVKAHEILKRDAPWGYSDRFAALMRFQAERAHRCYDEALALLPQAERRTLRPALILAHQYRALLREIERGGFQVLHQHVSLTPLRKLWIAIRTQWLGR